MWAYYNEIDPYPAQWLKNLIADRLIPRGEVDKRSILKVEPDDLRSFRQCHFFAGIGGWAYALQLAGWPDDREVWTASCPCQPLSSAGQRQGHADERHLWPALFRLIAVCRPATIFGEQVASKDGREWLAGIRADLEHLGYAVGAADLPAACVGAPHIRQRLFWVANSEEFGQWSSRRNDGFRTEEQCAAGGLADAEPQLDRSGLGGSGWRTQFANGGAAGGLADADGSGSGQENQAGFVAPKPDQGWQNGGVSVRNGDTGGVAQPERRGQGPASDPDVWPRLGQLRAGRSGPAGRLGDTGRTGLEGQFRPDDMELRRGSLPLRSTGSAGASWSDAVWLPCLDGKARRIEPGTFPLADGVSARVGRLRAYGNAIVPQVAAEFIRACDGVVTNARGLVANG